MNVQTARTADSAEQTPGPRARPAIGQDMTGADAVIHALEEQGVDTIFGYPGGAIMPIYDSLKKVDHGMTHILTAAEGGAGHMAQGYARTTGKPGVLFVTSGPGLTNAVTPIADAMGDSIPMVIISGQVPTSLIGTDAFQEVDATGITRPVTKFNMLVRSADELLPTLREAFALAASGRPGPVHVDIPKDVQNATLRYFAPTGAHTARARRKAMPTPIAAQERHFRHAVDLMRAARRPLFYVGGGVINSGDRASAELLNIMAATGFPATSTLMGLGAYPTSHPAHLGMPGMHGTYEANMAMHHADLIIAVGARFDDRVTGRLDAFAPQARIIHIDIDNAEIGKLVPVHAPLRGDAGECLQMLNALWRTQGAQADPARLGPWWEQIGAWRSVESLKFEEALDVIRPQHAMTRLAALLRTLPDYSVATNVGQHQMWAAQYLPFTKPRQFLTSGKVGTMGYGLPAGIGAQWANPERPVFVVTGDGSWRMNTGEVETASRLNLPVKTVLLNNRSLHMVGQWQGMFHGGRISESEFVGSTKSFVREFEAQGDNARGETIRHPSELDAAFSRMMTHTGPYLLEIMVPKEDCFPMVAAGKAHNDMMLSPETLARNPHLRPRMA